MPYIGVMSFAAKMRRTLSRRLRAEGTTFAALLEEVRYEVACQLLAHTDLLVRNVADTLDYANGDGLHAHVGELALFGIAEQVFHRVQLRGVGRQALELNVPVERLDVVPD